MKPHELNRMFHALAPGPERERALLEELLQNGMRRERPVKKWKRIAVWAAAAALLMTCTVGVVARFAPFSQIEVTEELQGWFSVSGGITYFPVDSLSEELQALEGQGLEDSVISNPTYFDSLEEAEKFVGLDLMNNPVLDASAAEIPYSALANPYFDSRFVVMADKNLRHIYVHGDYQIGEVAIHVDNDVFTDRSLELEESVRGTKLWYDFTEEKGNGVEVEEETYTAPSGLEARIMKHDGENGQCLTTVSLNGIRTIIVTSSPNSVKEARDVMAQVLNGFTP